MCGAIPNYQSTCGQPSGWIGRPVQAELLPFSFPPRMTLLGRTKTASAEPTQHVGRPPTTVSDRPVAAVEVLGKLSFNDTAHLPGPGLRAGSGAAPGSPCLCCQPLPHSDSVQPEKRNLDRSLLPRAMKEYEIRRRQGTCAIRQVQPTERPDPGERLEQPPGLVPGPANRADTSTADLLP